MGAMAKHQPRAVLHPPETPSNPPSSLALYIGSCQVIKSTQTAHSGPARRPCATAGPNRSTVRGRPLNGERSESLERVCAPTPGWMAFSVKMGSPRLGSAAADPNVLLEHRSTPTSRARGCGALRDAEALHRVSRHLGEQQTSRRCALWTIAWIRARLAVDGADRSLQARCAGSVPMARCWRESLRAPVSVRAHVCPRHRSHCLTARAGCRRQTSASRAPGPASIAATRASNTLPSPTASLSQARSGRLITSVIGPRATARPCSRISTCVARRTTSSRSWVTSINGISSARRSVSISSCSIRRTARSTAAKGSSSSKHRRLARQCPRQRHTLPLAAGEFVGCRFMRSPQVNQGSSARRVRLRSARGQMAQRGRTFPAALRCGNRA